MLQTLELRSAPSARPPSACDVVVIGAGLSGLVCAHRLAQKGVRNVAVFEAKSRVGGRTLNQPLDAERFVEGGGQWVGPTQDRVLALADELGVATFPSYDRGRHVLELGGRRCTFRYFPLAFAWQTLDFARAAIQLERASRRVDQEEPWKSPDAARLDETTLQEWIDGHVSTAGARALFDVVSGLTLGGDPRDLSLLAALQHIRAAGGLARLLSVKGGAQERRLVGGAQGLSLRLAASLAPAVHLATPVEALGWNESGVTVRAQGVTTKARCVVFAMSPPDRAKIAFEPGLPAPASALQAQMAMFKGIKVHAVYDRPFWRENGLSGQALSDQGPAAATFDNSPHDGSIGVMTAFVAGKVSDKSVAATEPQLADPSARRQGVLDRLVRYFGEEAREPIAYLEQDWRAEPFSSGCIPSVPPGLLTTPGIAESGDDVGPIVWAGSESSHVWNGYMDGAVRAGERAAAAAAQIVAGS